MSRNKAWPLLVVSNWLTVFLLSCKLSTYDALGEGRRGYFILCRSARVRGVKNGILFYFLDHSEFPECFSSCSLNSQMVTDIWYLHLRFFRFFFSFLCFNVVWGNNLGKQLTCWWESGPWEHIDLKFSPSLRLLKSWRKAVGIAFELSLFSNWANRIVRFSAASTWICWGS